jgi:hypothetical protein
LTWVNAVRGSRRLNGRMTRAIPRFSFLAAVAAATLALAAAAQDPDTVTLDPVVVTAPAAPLDRSLYLLRIMVGQSTPCLGCDAVLVERPWAMRTLLDYLLWPGPPPEVDESTRMARQIKLQDSPDLDYLRP